MGLLDALFSGNSDGGGLLSLLRNNALNQSFPTGPSSDQAQYGSPSSPMGGLIQPPVFQQPNAPSPLDTAQWPAGPVGAPSQANAQMPGVSAGVPQQPPAPVMAQPQAAQQPQQPQAVPSFLQSPASTGGFSGAAKGALANTQGGPLGMIFGALGGAMGMGQGDPQTIQRQNLKAQYDALVPLVGPQKAMLAVMNPEFAKTIGATLGNHDLVSIGEGHILDKTTGKVSQAYESADKTPQSVLEYNYYKSALPPGQQPMDYATFSTAKARAGATNINNSVDMNSGQTYDKQLSEGLGKSHAALANGVEDAQTRARDMAAMQGAIDAIQKNGGSTGGMGQQQIQDLKKTINSSAAGLGITTPFDEKDISDKEFLTKFNRQIAGAQAKGAVGSRVTNFEMSNYLKANPGLDMSITGNQRLIGIQSQIEQRNIAVGNAIRDATAQAISKGQKIDPVTVQKIITDYDGAHHISDPITHQDLTQNYSLPEFQNQPNSSNKQMSDQHSANIKVLGGRKYQKINGAWHEIN